MGCERLANGVVQEIQFPEHQQKLAVTLIANSQGDTLVARAQNSIGILDSIGSHKIKEAVFTLTHSNGVQHTWGGTEDWLSGVGHVLIQPELEAGTWTLLAEAPNFEEARASQTTPPIIDTTGTYALQYEVVQSDWEVEVFEEEGLTYYYGEERITVELTLPTRSNESDQFILQAHIASAEAVDDEEKKWVNISEGMGNDPRIKRLSLIDGILIREWGETEDLNNIQLELNYAAVGEDLELVTNRSITLGIAAVSPEIALYYESIDAILHPQGLGIFSEPLLAYTNMSSGYGCFGLYTSIDIPLE